MEYAEFKRLAEEYSGVCKEFSQIEYILAQNLPIGDLMEVRKGMCCVLAAAFLAKNYCRQEPDSTEELNHALFEKQHFFTAINHETRPGNRTPQETERFVYLKDIHVANRAEGQISEIQLDEVANQTIAAITCNLLTRQSEHSDSFYCSLVHGDNPEEYAKSKIDTPGYYYISLQGSGGHGIAVVIRSGQVEKYKLFDPNLGRAHFTSKDNLQSFFVPYLKAISTEYQIAIVRYYA